MAVSKGVLQSHVYIYIKLQSIFGGIGGVSLSKLRVKLSILIMIINDYQYYSDNYQLSEDNIGQ